MSDKYAPIFQKQLQNLAMSSVRIQLGEEVLTASLLMAIPRAEAAGARADPKARADPNPPPCLGLFLLLPGWLAPPWEVFSCPSLTEVGPPRVSGVSVRPPLSDDTFPVRGAVWWQIPRGAGIPPSGLPGAFSQPRESLPMPPTHHFVAPGYYTTPQDEASSWCSTSQPCPLPPGETHVRNHGFPPPLALCLSPRFIPPFGMGTASLSPPGC